jgi:hypothetical protein
MEHVLAVNHVGIKGKSRRKRNYLPDERGLALVYQTRLLYFESLTDT